MTSTGNIVKWLNGKIAVANISKQSVIDFLGVDRSTYHRWEKKPAVIGENHQRILILAGNKIQEMIDTNELPVGPGKQNQWIGSRRFTKHIEGLFDAPTLMEE